MDCSKRNVRKGSPNHDFTVMKESEITLSIITRNKYISACHISPNGKQHIMVVRLYRSFGLLSLLTAQNMTSIASGGIQFAKFSVPQKFHHNIQLMMLMVGLAHPLRPEMGGKATVLRIGPASLTSS